MKCTNCYEPKEREQMWDWGRKLYCSNRCAFLYFERHTSNDAQFINKMKMSNDPLTAVYANGVRPAQRTFIAIAGHCPEVVY